MLERFLRYFYHKDELIKKTVKKALILLSITLVMAIILGLLLGHFSNMREVENLLESKRPSLPSILLDRNGEIISKYYSDEKRDMISLDQVPEYLVRGLILWEDDKFFSHHGFNIWAIVRASVSNLIGRPVSGASTLTQQLARTLFLSHKFTWTRKIRELWIAIQLEKKYTKNELLTLYLNHVPLGYGTNGVSAASKFYFDKDVQDLTPSESASLISIISNPTYYSFIRFPRNHKMKQKEVMKKMVRKGVLTPIEAETSLNEFWLRWQSSGQTARGAFFNREDNAPYFSDWVLNQIEKEMPHLDVFRDGLVIHSTLDLKWQKLAEELMKERLDVQQKIFEAEQIKSYNIVQEYFIDTVELLAESFSLSNIKVNQNKEITRAVTIYNKDINPSLNLTSQIFGLNLVNTVTDVMFDKGDIVKSLLSEVQGAFIAIDNQTGQIITMVGGREFDPNNRFNYAMQSRRQPGSAFKPLFYSAAFDTKTFTPASIIIDAPHVFTFDSDDPDEWYIPYNYGARYYGKINVREALRRSLNIPACKVFYAVGYNNKYKVPIDRAALLLGLRSQREIDQRFATEISTALGTCSVAPIEMTTAFNTFANLGKRRVPNAIVYIEDRDGRIIYEPWKEMQKYYRENDRKLQIITPENAYMLTSILNEVDDYPGGTLVSVRQRFIDEKREFSQVPFAVKTGTTQNWSDAWVVGYSPVITACSWVGFKEYGLSLGYERSAESVNGSAWMEYMRQYHLNMDKVDFKIPEKINSVKICRQSGLLPSPFCAENDTYFEYFLPGTAPKEKCNYCESVKYGEKSNLQSIEDSFDRFFDKFKKKDIFSDVNINVDKSILNEFRSDKPDIDIDEKLIKIDLFKDSPAPVLDDLNSPDEKPQPFTADLKDQTPDDSVLPQSTDKTSDSQ